MRVRTHPCSCIHNQVHLKRSIFGSKLYIHEHTCMKYLYLHIYIHMHNSDYLQRSMFGSKSIHSFPNLYVRMYVHTWMWGIHIENIPICSYAFARKLWLCTYVYVYMCITPVWELDAADPVYAHICIHLKSQIMYICSHVSTGDVMWYLILYIDLCMYVRMFTYTCVYMCASDIYTQS